MEIGSAEKVVKVPFWRPCRLPEMEAISECVNLRVIL